MPIAPRLVDVLMQYVNGLVVDRTGLSGVFDVDLQWTPTADQIPQRLRGAIRENLPVDPNVPSLFAALQEQLGLRLEAERGPAEVLVIDRVERPTSD